MRQVTIYGLDGTVRVLRVRTEAMGYIHTLIHDLYGGRGVKGFKVRSA